MINSIVIIGANLAGGRAAEALRRGGFEGRLALIGDEPWRPYERPPLSKEILWDSTKLPDTFFLHDEAWYRDNRIDLHLGQGVDALDLAAAEVRLRGGATIAADRILLATGGRARRLSLAGADATNVHHLRTKDDADRLARDLRPGARIVVIGMGVIGSEVAASARKVGCEVYAIEPAPVPMIRTIGERFGHWLAGNHRRRGVLTNFGVSPVALRVEGQMVRAVKLSNGETVDCDAVVVGIGIVPATDLASGAGLAVNNGIVVDRRGQTSHPNIFAAGDVANQPGFHGGRVRLETYQNAADQGAVAALSMLGHDGEYFKPCWFWSDQYDLNIQVVGRIDDALPVVVRGDMEANDFSAFFMEGGVMAGMLTVNRAADMGVGKRLVERRIIIDRGMLEDSSTPLRELLKGKPLAV